MKLHMKKTHLQRCHHSLQTQTYTHLNSFISRSIERGIVVFAFSVQVDHAEFGVMSHALLDKRWGCLLI